MTKSTSKSTSRSESSESSSSSTTITSTETPQEPEEEVMTKKSRRQARWEQLKNLLAQAAVISVVTIALALATAVYFDYREQASHVELRSLDPSDLGELCPGDLRAINTHVTVNRPVFMFVSISTMNSDGTYNIIGTDTHYDSLPHPRPGRFVKTIGWRVPNIDPGRYRRVFSIRIHDSELDPVFTETFYTISKKEICDERR